MSYTERLQQEIAYYKEVTNVHELPGIFHYWGNKFLRPKFESLGFSNPSDFHLQYMVRVANQYPDQTCEILSVGAGNCDAEVALAKGLREKQIQNFTFSCMDINPQMLARGAQLASENQLSQFFQFLEMDLNEWRLEKQYQIILASQSLHHFVELERLFDNIYDSLDEKGFFITDDMIGRNGHMRWPEAVEILFPLWGLLEERHKWNRGLNRLDSTYVNWDCSKEGFEGIRAQDILPLLINKFKFDCFVGFANLITVFVDRNFGHNFDANNPWDCCFIDFVAGIDDYYIETGRIKPTQMVAAMTRNGSSPVRLYKHLSPEFCLRDPQPPSKTDL